MRHILKLLALIAVAGGSPSCSMTVTHDSRPVEVLVYEARPAEINTKYTYIGKAEPSKNTVIHSQVSGTLSDLRIRKGQQVKKGDVLAVIESEGARSAYEIAEANLMLARDGYDRAVEVYSSGSITEQKMTEIRSQLAKAEASERAAAKVLSDCFARAPYDGVVSDVLVEEGVELQAFAPVARLLDIHEQEISFAVPEKEINSIHCGRNAVVAIPALGLTVRAPVISTGSTASPMSHTYDCRLSPGEVPGLLPGMVCKVSMISEDNSGVEIPANAVMTDMNGNYVWMVEDGAVAKRYIVTDGYSADGVIVTEGLSEGDPVIVEGRRKVSAGMKVQMSRR